MPGNWDGQHWIPNICFVPAGHDFLNFRSLLKFGDVTNQYKWQELKQINGRIRHIRCETDLVHLLDLGHPNAKHSEEVGWNHIHLC